MASVADEVTDEAGIQTAPAFTPEQLHDTLIASNIALDGPPTSTLARSAAAVRPPAPSLTSLPKFRVTPDMADIAATSDFQVSEVLGKGGMGIVELASQRALGRDVALKRLRFAPSEALIHALLDEARITGHLEHPNIVPVHALGVDDDGGPVVVMKRIRGVPWSTLIEQGETGIARHIEILMQVCNALHFAHSNQIIHCDVKPANVMVGDFGEVYLVDWGIALRLADHADHASHDDEPRLRGTPAYMAPELVAGHRQAIGAWTDVFLLGACLHEVLTGQPRHRGQTLVSVLTAASLAEPATYAEHVPAALAHICERACAKARTHRHHSALELRSALQDYLAEDSARELTEAAMRRLEALERAIAADAPEIESLFHAVEFAFEYVLETRPDMPEASDGLHQCLLAMLEHELERGNLESAKTLAARLGEVSEPLQQRLDALRANHDGARLRLAEFEHAGDTNVARTQRRWLGVALILFMITLVATLYFFNRTATTAFSAAGLFAIATVISTFIGACIVVWRKHLFANDYNRRWAHFLLGSISAIMLHRGVAVIAGTAPTDIVIGDLAICGCAFLAAAWLSRAFYVVGPILFAMSALAAWHPASARWLLNSAGLGFALTFWWSWRRGQITQARPDDS